MADKGSQSVSDRCPICGSKLVRVKYTGHNPELLRWIASPDFCCLMGCLHEELHGKDEEGGRVYIVPRFHVGFPCRFVDGVVCPDKRAGASIHFCWTCRYYKEFNKDLLAEDEKVMDEIDDERKREGRR